MENNLLNIFISYSTRNEDDIRLANFIYKSLQGANRNIFYSDATANIGKKWADQVDYALNVCDYFILIISNESVLSDMVLEEVRRAKKQKDLKKKPEIIPIRMKVPLNLELPYILSAYIQPVQYFNWQTMEDNENLLQYLKKIIDKRDVDRTNPPVVKKEISILREQIQSFIANGRTEQALVLLAKFNTDTTLLQSQYTDGKKNFALSRIDFGEWQRVQGRVNAGALEILEQITYQDDPNAFQLYSANIEEIFQTLEPRYPLSSAGPWINDQTESRNFYVERSTDEKCRQVIFRPYSILRIKAPRQYGKTTLLSHLTLEAKKRSYSTIIVDFQLFSETELSDLDRLLKLICATASEQLHLTEKVGEYWEALHRSQLDKMFQYFDEYLLKNHQGPILFAIDKADKLFKYRDNTTDFFGMLRSWHETSKNTNDPKWKHFSMIITYSTDDIPIEDLNRSFFNVGEEVVLHEFEPEQVLDLAKAHKLKWRFETAKTIQELLGGHPYLVKRALYEISENDYPLESLLDDAISDDGPFGDHLKRIFFKLSKEQRRLDTLKNILQTGTSGNYQECMYLKALGLIKSTSAGYDLRSELYRRYFQSKLIPSRPHSFLSRLFNFFKIR